jgi:hypothetical protein
VENDHWAVATEFSVPIDLLLQARLDDNQIHFPFDHFPSIYHPPRHLVALAA